MRLAKVVGQVVATVKDSGLDRFKLLVLQDATGVSQARTSGPVYVAIVIGDFMRDAQPLGALLRAGVIDPTVVASERVSLDDVPAAYRRMAERSTLKAPVLA